MAPMTAMRQLRIRYIALGVLFMLMSGVLWLYPVVAKSLLVLSGLSFAIAIAIRLKIWRDVDADRYSLTSLNEIIREGTYDENEIPDVDHEGDKYCLSCHLVYGSQFGVCPKCGR